MNLVMHQGGGISNYDNEVRSSEGYRLGAPHEVGRRERENSFEISEQEEFPGVPVKKEAREGFREQVGDDTFARRIESFYPVTSMLLCQL